MLIHSKRCILTALLILLSALSATKAAGQLVLGTPTGLGGQNRITGTVLTPDGQRATGHIAVTLVTESRGDRVAITDDSGNFAFTGLVNGDYSLLINKEKLYEPYTYPVTIRQRAGFPVESILVNMRLIPKKGKLVKPAVVNARFVDVPREALDLYNAGVELGKKGDRKGAIEQLQMAVGQYPKFVDAYNEMGVEYLGLGDFGHATEAFQSALKIDPNAFGPMMNFGMTLFLMKRYPDADPVLRAAVAMKGDQAAPHYFLGQNTAYLGKFEEAEKELQLALKLGEAQVVEAYRLLAIIHFSQGKKSQAADDLEAYLKVNPTASDAEQLKKNITTYRQ